MWRFSINDGLCLRFSGDENKKTLLDLNAHEALLKLVTHEERLVRRNAVMAIGVMARHGEYRSL